MRTEDETNTNLKTKEEETMLSANEIDELYDEVNRPYTAEELEYHRTHRTAKNELEEEHAYNYEAIEIVEDWISYLNGHGEQPLNMIWRVIRPSNHVPHGRCKRLEKIVEYFSQFDYGKCPQFPIAVFCSRSSATLMQQLERLLASSHLANADDALKEMISLICNIKTSSSVRGEKFSDAILRLKETFLAEIKSYSFDLGIYLRQKQDEIEKEKTKAPPVEEKIVASLEKISSAVEKGAAKIATAKIKKRGKHARFSVAVQEAVYAIWERECKNIEVKAMRTGLPKYSDAFQHGKSDFISAGAPDVKTLKSLLKARADRISRSNLKRLSSTIRN